MPHELPPLIGWAQRNALLIDRDVHALHHVDFNMNFAILNGRSNPIVNWLTAKVLSQLSRLWLAVLIGWGAVPLLVGRGLYERDRRGVARGKVRGAEVLEEVRGLRSSGSSEVRGRPWLVSRRP
jgi:hypothetical protein